MNKTEMLQALEAAVPPLRGKLHIERVLYKKAANKAYMSFLCDDLVREGEFLQVERTLKELFPQVNVGPAHRQSGAGRGFSQPSGQVPVRADGFSAPPKPGAAGVAG